MADANDTRAMTALAAWANLEPDRAKAMLRVLRQLIAEEKRPTGRPKPFTDVLRDASLSPGEKTDEFDRLLAGLPS